MQPVKMYTTQVCPYCVRAKALLKQRGVDQIAQVARVAAPCRDVGGLLRVTRPQQHVVPLRGRGGQRRAPGSRPEHGDLHGREFS